MEWWQTKNSDFILVSSLYLITRLKNLMLVMLLQYISAVCRHGSPALRESQNLIYTGSSFYESVGQTENLEHMYGKEKKGYHRELFRRRSKEVKTDLAQSLRQKREADDRWPG